MLRASRPRCPRNPFAPLRPPGPGEEIGILKSLITIIRDYKSLPSVTEQERAEIGKAE